MFHRLLVLRAEAVQSEPVSRVEEKDDDSRAVHTASNYVD